MASNIDETKPTSGTALTSDVRANFSAAKTEIEALQAFDGTTLPSTSNGEGASLIGIEDSAGNFTSTDVEGALAETLSNLGSTATDDGTKGFHLVSIPPITGETGIENHAFARNNVLRFIPYSLHAGIRDRTNTTDLRSYVQNAFDSTNDIYFPGGDYRIESQISRSTGQFRMYGEGKYLSRIIMPQTWDGSTGGKSILSVGDTVDFTKIEDVFIEDLSFEYDSRIGSNTASSIYPGIQIYKIDGFSLRRCRIKNTQGVGILCSGIENFVVAENDFISTRRDGIQMSNAYANAAAPMTPKNGRVIKNYIYDARDDGIAIGSSWKNDANRNIAYNIVIENNTIDTVIFGSGIYINGIDGFSIAKNIIRDCHKGGIRAARNGNDQGYPVKNGEISNNIITNVLGIAANDTIEGATITPNRSSFSARGEIMLAENSLSGTQHTDPAMENVKVSHNLISTNCNNGIVKEENGSLLAGQYASDIRIENNQVIFTDSSNADDHRGLFIEKCTSITTEGNLVKGFTRQGAVWRVCAKLRIIRNEFVENCSNSITATMINVLDTQDATYDFLEEFSDNYMERTSGTLFRMLILYNAGGTTDYRYYANRKNVTGATVTNSDSVNAAAAEVLQANKTDVVMSSAGSTGGTTSANGTVAVNIDGTTYYLLKAASA